jgi:hypothetical protein
LAWGKKERGAFRRSFVVARRGCDFVTATPNILRQSFAGGFMAVSISLIAGVSALAVLAILATRKKTEEEMMISHTKSFAVPVQIVCGDCAGEDNRPKRTCLNAQGQCERCGGHSYVLASTIVVQTLRARIAQLSIPDSPLSYGRVLPFEVLAQKQKSRMNKIAV